MDQNDAVDRDALLARYGMKPSVTTEEAMRAHEQALMRRGWWSLTLAIGSLVLWPVLTFILVVVLSPLGGGADPAFQRAFSFGRVVVHSIAGVMAIAGVGLGVTSVLGGWPRSGQAGQIMPIMLGVFSILIGAVVSTLLFSGIPPLVG